MEDNNRQAGTAGCINNEQKLAGSGGFGMTGVCSINDFLYIKRNRKTADTITAAITI